jgi:membrane fusion protein, multidrug efflux system
MSFRTDKLRKVLLVALLACAAAGTAHWWLLLRPFVKLENAFLVGRVINIDAPMDGVVESVNIVRFSTLGRDTPAFIISGGEAANRFRNAELALRAALSEAGQSCIKLDSQAERVRLAELSLKLADEFKQDAQRLREKGYVSLRDVEQREIDERKARITHQMELLEKRRLEMDVGEWTPGSGKLASSIEQLRQAWIDRKRSAVRLQSDIFVYDIHVLPGQWIEQGTPLATVIPIEPVRVQANVLETQIGKVFPGQAAEIRVDGLSEEQVLRGHVETVVPATAATFSQIQRNTADSTWLKVSQRIPVVIKIDDALPSSGISIGQSVEVKLLPRKADPAVSTSRPQVDEPASLLADHNMDREISQEINRVREDVVKRLQLPARCNLFRFDNVEDGAVSAQR